MKPTVARNVHYRVGSNVFAGIVNSINEVTQRPNITYFTSTTTGFALDVEEGNGEGQWCWPPRPEIEALKTPENDEEKDTATPSEADDTAKKDGDK